MILKQLYELAEREGLLDEVAFEHLSVRFVLKINSAGEYLNLIETRRVATPTAHVNESRQDSGQSMSIPRAHANTANRGFSRFFVDTLERVLPIGFESKWVASRKTFWEQIEFAASNLNDPAIESVRLFGKQLSIKESSTAKRVLADISAASPHPGNRCTFTLEDDSGRTILERPAIKLWWRNYYEDKRKIRQEEGNDGICQITHLWGPIASIHPTKLYGVPGGLTTGTALVSTDKAAFASYRFNRATCAGIGYRAADGYARALNALITNTVPSYKGCKSSIRIGDSIALIWLKNTDSHIDVVSALEVPTMLNSGALAASVQLRKPPTFTASSALYCLILKANAARIVVQSFTSGTVNEIVRNLQNWYDDISIVDAGGARIRNDFRISNLATSAANGDGTIPSSIPEQLLLAALQGQSLSQSLLTNCVQRLAGHNYDGFSAERMAVIKLFLRRQDRRSNKVTSKLDLQRVTPPYVCGRLLSVFERIQYFAVGEVNTSVVDRFYASASSSPRLIFPLLFRSSEYHLRKIFQDRGGLAVNLRKDIERLSAELTEFPARFVLIEQADFALGFYHQRAAYRELALAGRVTRSGKSEEDEVTEEPTWRRE